MSHSETPQIFERRAFLKQAGRPYFRKPQGIDFLARRYREFLKTIILGLHS